MDNPPRISDAYGTKELTTDTVDAITGRAVGLYLDDQQSEHEVIGLFVLTPEQALNLADMLQATAARADAENGRG